MEPQPPAELADVDHRIRIRTIHRLAEAGDPYAVRWIRPLLDDRESLVRSAAIVALGQLHDEEAFDAIVGFLEARTTHERGNALDALVALNGARLREPLIRAMETEPWSLLRAQMIRAL
ncbi:MAG TPA: HEAT repeat domain-containing protein, partial [Ktedonobacterales bacterium]|nr:HEAT repeat domain-containing protein [Ktedonobacterales bacterium]